MTNFQLILHSKVALGAFSGFIAAAAVDFHAFLSWKNADDALHYEWKVAGWRWFQGTVGGAVAAAGLGLTLG